MPPLIPGTQRDISGAPKISLEQGLGESSVIGGRGQGDFSICTAGPSLHVHCLFIWGASRRLRGMVRLLKSPPATTEDW